VCVSILPMFLRQHTRSKDGKDHTYWSLVESVRTPEGPRLIVTSARKMSGKACEFRRPWFGVLCTVRFQYLQWLTNKHSCFVYVDTLFYVRFRVVLCTLVWPRSFHMSPMRPAPVVPVLIPEERYL
jgi:hypothetical protein